jgi:hypothetical protein
MGKNLKSGTFMLVVLATSGDRTTPSSWCEC